MASRPKKIGILDFENDPKFAIHFTYYWLTGHRLLSLHNMTWTINFDGIMWHLYLHNFITVIYVLGLATS